MSILNEKIEFFGKRGLIMNTLKYADDEDLANGWTLSYEMLIEIKEFLNEVNDEYICPSLEEIESVLLAYVLLYDQK